jgi:hypothetical protein
MVTNYKIFMGILAVAIAVGFAFWPNSNDSFAVGTVATVAVSAPRTPARISIWEIHSLAHLENLPVQNFEDQSLIFHQAQH